MLLCARVFPTTRLDLWAFCLLVRPTLHHVRKWATAIQCKAFVQTDSMPQTQLLDVNIQDVFVQIMFKSNSTCFGYTYCNHFRKKARDHFDLVVKSV